MELTGTVPSVSDTIFLPNLFDDDQGWGKNSKKVEIPRPC